MMLTILLNVQNMESSWASHLTIEPKCPNTPDPKMPPLVAMLLMPPFFAIFDFDSDFVLQFYYNCDQYFLLN